MASVCATRRARGPARRWSRARPGQQLRGAESEGAALDLIEPGSGHGQRELGRRRQVGRGRGQIGVRAADRRRARRRTARRGGTTRRGWRAPAASSARRRRAARRGPPGRSTRAHSAKNGSSAAKLRSAKPDTTPSTEAVGNGRRSASPRTRGAATRCVAQHARREVDADRAADPGSPSSRHRSPVPHARSRTSAPGASRSSRDCGAAPADVHAEREHAVEQVVARRDAVEHLLDGARPCRPSSGGTDVGAAFTT